MIDDIETAIERCSTTEELLSIWDDLTEEEKVTYKESFRKLEDDLNQGYDIVVVARVISNKASYHQIEDNLYKLLGNLIKS